MTDTQPPAGQGPPSAGYTPAPASPVPPGYPPSGYAAPSAYASPAGYMPPPGYGASPAPYWQPAPPVGALSAPAPGGIPLRPLSVGDILSGGFALIRRNPAATFGLSAIIIATTAILVAAIAFAASRISQPLGWLTLPVVLAAATILPGGLIAAMARALLGRKVRLREAVRMSRPGWVFLTIVLLGLGVAAIWVPLYLLIKGWVFLPGIALTWWLGPMLSLTVPVVVLERRNPLRAVARSWQLVRGSYWRVLGIYLLIYLIIDLISYATTFPLFVVIGFAGAAVDPGGAASSAAPVVIIAVLAAWEIVLLTLGTGVEAGVLVLVYADMRIRKEGLDLVLLQSGQGSELTGEEFATASLAAVFPLTGHQAPAAPAGTPAGPPAP